MNTRNKWTTTATIHDEQRRAVWVEIFEDGTVPIKSILTSKTDMPGRKNADVYMLDLAAISDEQRQKLVEVLARRFNIHPAEMAWELNRGVPILAEDVTVSTTDIGLFL